MSHARSEGSQKVDWWLLAALTLVGAALRFFNIGDKSLWYDEASTYHMVQGAWRDVLALNATANSAPPLYPLLLALLTGPSASEAVLRAPAALAGILAIPASWLLARELVASRWALVVPLLVALSPTQVEYSQEVREYSLAFAAACFILTAYVRLLTRPDLRRALWVAAAATLGLCTQYGIAVLIAGAALVSFAELLRRPQPQAALYVWFLAHLPIGVAALALYFTTIRTQLAAVALGKAAYLIDRYGDGTLSGIVALVAPSRGDFVHFAFPGKLMFAVTALGAGAWLVRRGSGRAFALLAAPTLLTFVCAVAGIYPFGAIRQDMFLLPMVYVCAAIGVGALASFSAERVGKWGIAVVLALLAATAWPGAMRSVQLVRAGGPEPMRPLVAELSARLDPGERIYVYWGALPAFRYYWRGRNDPWQQGAVHWSGLDREGAARQMRNVEAELLELVAAKAPFWLVLSHLRDDDAEAIVAFLRQHGAANHVAGSLGSYLLRVVPRTAAPPAGAT